jgi:chemotaxis protein methyltransferase CheR
MSNPVLDSTLLSIGPKEFRLFRELIHHHTGIWLRDGKEVMLASRLTRRMRLHQMTDFADYYRYIEDNGAELGEMINCITTNKTAFFRERHHFAFLTETAMPEILSRAGIGPAGRTSIAIWCAASSTGEEPYSIAITLLEAQLRRSAVAWDMHIVASDIDTTVLAKARRAVYGDECLEEVEQPLRRKYFLRGKDDMAGFVKVKEQVTSKVQFQRINLVDRSWPLTEMFDIVFFRNALIYFKHETQDLILRRIVRQLKPEGFLFLGHSEHIPWLGDILEPMQKTVYRLRSTQK